MVGRLLICSSWRRVKRSVRSAGGRQVSDPPTKKVAHQGTAPGHAHRTYEYEMCVLVHGWVRARTTCARCVGVDGSECTNQRRVGPAPAEMARTYPKLTHRRLLVFIQLASTSIAIKTKWLTLSISFELINYKPMKRRW